MSTTVSKHVPSPADEPEFTAREFLEQVRERGGRVHRMRTVGVFCLTDDPELAQWLLDQGAEPYKPIGSVPGYGGPLGGYLRAKGGTPEWDLYIHTCRVRNADEEETIWEAAGKLAPTVEGADYA